AGAFEFDDREGPVRDMLFGEITRWRSALRRTVLQAIEAGHLHGDTDADQLVSEINSLALGLIHDARFLRDNRAAERAQATWLRLLATYKK
ncbi:MAG: TetR/AcrR family transcriptional regulator, partial [Ramlibacter sp.]